MVDYAETTRFVTLLLLHDYFRGANRGASLARAGNELVTNKPDLSLAWLHTFSSAA